MSIGLFYNAEVRNNGTGVLVWDALRDIRGHGHGMGLEMKRYSRPGINVSEHVLNIQIDDGRDDIDWTPPKPNAIWLIDTHLGYDRRLSWARDFDYVFTAQKAGAVKMREDGIEKAFWLPLACHPPAHPNYSEMMVHPEKDHHCGDRGLEKQHDLAFVGFMQDPPDEPGYHNRINYLDAMFKAFPDSWLTISGFWEDMAVRYIRSRLGFNVSIRDDLNMRFFEVMSTGTAMMSNGDQEGYEDVGFVPDEHFIVYDGVNEAIDKATYYLNHSTEREEIAKKGHELVRGNHTYQHRLKHMLDICGVK
jgi:hypothetical protein